MKVLVPIKRVIDSNIKVNVKSDETGVDTQNLKMAINPFCEIAIEEAIRLKEKGVVDEIVVLTIGVPKSMEQIRLALALGADRGIILETEATYLDPLTIAKLIQKINEEENCDLFLFGKQTIDGDNAQTPQILAGLLDYPQATFASEVTLNKDDRTVSVEREIDGGLQTLSLNLPAVVSTDLRLNEPRYAKLPDIMKAKKKPVDIRSAESLEINLTPANQSLKVESPPTREAGIMVKSVEELVDKLKNEARVI